MRPFLFLLVCFCLCTDAYAQMRTSSSAAGYASTANDLRSAILYPPEAQTASSTRSIPLAAALSAVVPGAGQVYNRNWIKAAAGVAIEAALITAYLTWHGDGKDAERAYQAYAHAHWSPLRYAEWLQDYSDWLPATPRYGIDVPVGIDFSNPSAWSDMDRQRAREFFQQIRTVEGEVYHPETGAAFSHKLPFFGEQQYYELIGKYFQFAPGWDDYDVWRDSEGNYVDAVIDPERTAADGSKPNIKGRFAEYASDHAEANTLLRKASRVTAFIMLNHVVAAIDAAVSAKLHNDRISSGMTLAPTPHGDVAPMAYVRVTL